jgi:hypothetical protein
MMAVIDADSGKVVATPEIGEGVDANAFDPTTKFAFASNGEGTVTMVHEDSPDKFGSRECSYEEERALDGVRPANT